MLKPFNSVENAKKPYHIEHAGYTVSRAYSSEIVVETASGGSFFYDLMDNSKSDTRNGKRTKAGKAMQKAVEFFMDRENRGYIRSFTFHNNIVNGYLMN